MIQNNKRSLFFLLLIPFFTFALSHRVLAQCPESNLSQNLGNDVNSHTNCGQVFTASCSGNIVSVTVVYNLVPVSTQDRILNIRDGDLPTSPIIHTQVIPYSSLVLGANVFVLSTPVPINAFEVNAWEITDTAASVGSADGISWNSAGSYTGGDAWFSGSILAGFDITFEVQINTCLVSTGTDTITACDSLAWIDGNTYSANNNTATFNLVGGAANGCDSLVTLDLTIVNSATSTDTVTACNAYVWIDGITYSASNDTATFNFVGGAANGCDSLVILDLTIVNSATGTDTVTACNTYVWMDGITYSVSNDTATFNFVGGAANGCDSLVTLDLTIVNSATGTDTVTACNAYVWMDGITYSASNDTATFNFVGGAANGCDSLVTLDLTIVNSATGTDAVTACDAFAWMDGITYSASNDTATFNFVGGAANGCDSLVTLDLIINTVNTGVTQNGLALTSDAGNATYQWLNCDIGNSIISGETNQSFTPTLNGNYAVAVTENGCTDTSSCMSITVVGIIKSDFNFDFVIYPNPNSGKFIIEFKSTSHNTRIDIYDMLGKKIVNINSAEHKTSIDISNKPKGIYMVKITDDGKTTFQKITNQ